MLPPSTACRMHRARERRRSYSGIGRPRAWWWCHARDCTTFIIAISWHYAMSMLRLDHKVLSNIYPLEHASRRHWRTLFPSHSRWRCETFVKVGTLAPPYAPGRQTQQSEQEESGREERERGERGGRAGFLMIFMIRVIFTHLTITRPLARAARPPVKAKQQLHAIPARFPLE